MDLRLSSHEAPNEFSKSEFGEGLLHGDHDHHYGKSSHAFRTISEVSDELDVPQHVLRFWESKFAQIRPLKRGGGRRYYRPEDIELLKRIKNYLYKQGYTIKGVQRLLKEKRSEAVASFVPYASPVASVPSYAMAKPSMTIPVSSFLSAAAAAPSALAMAYGSIGGQIAEMAGKHHFSDAFEHNTLRVIQDEIAAYDQMEKTLLAVTKIHDELSVEVKPIRIVNPSAPLLEDAPEPVVEGLPLLSLPQIPEYHAVASNAAPIIEDVVAHEAFEAEEFNQDVAQDDVPVKRLDDGACDIVSDIVCDTVCDAVVMEAAPVAEPFIAPPIAPAIAPPAPSIAPEKKAQLLDILAEMVSLRDMLNTGVTA